MAPHTRGHAAHMNTRVKRASSIAAILALGVVTTLGISTFIANAPNLGTETHSSKYFPMGGGWVEFESWGRITLNRGRPSQSDVTPQTPEDETLKNFVFWDSCGWPWRCMGHGINMQDGKLLVYKAIVVLDGDRQVTFDFEKHQVTQTFPHTGSFVIPTGVHSTRMLGNIAVWSAAWALVWFWSASLISLPSTIRRVTRRRAGRCESCGYPRPTDAASCPECGHSDNQAH